MNITRRIAAALLAIAPLLALTAGNASASASARVLHRHVLSHCTARGDFAICVTGGTTGPDPTNIRVHVLTRHPGQSVLVSWDDVCGKGFGAGSRSGQFNAITTVNRRIAQPYVHPDNCTVSADAQLNNPGGGRWIEVEITYWN
jgi:hypothetical protein